jgi:hypothetical protein
LEAQLSEFYWQGCSDLLDLASLFAAVAPVVFEHEADLVALVEQSDSCRFKLGRVDDASLLPSSSSTEPKSIAVLKSSMLPVTGMRRTFPSCT